MSKLRVLVSREEIEKAVARLAWEVQRDYQGKRPLLLGVLKGAFVFMSDLIRHLDMPLELDFVQLSSYEGGTETSGEVKLVREPKTPVKGRHVLIVEDIVDTGLTTHYLLGYLQAKGAASVRICALLDKPSRRQQEVPIQYLGFTVPDQFLVGYGLDFNEEYRYLPQVCVLEGEG